MAWRANQDRLIAMGGRRDGPKGQKVGEMGRRWVLCVLAVVGCAGEPSPEEKCEALLDSVCDQVSACLPQLGSHATCVRELGGALPCRSVKEVTSSYDTCIDRIQDGSCSTLFPIDRNSGEVEVALPAACSGVLISATAPDPAGSTASSLHAPAQDRPHFVGLGAAWGTTK